MFKDQHFRAGIAVVMTASSFKIFTEQKLYKVSVANYHDNLSHFIQAVITAQSRHPG